MCRRTKWFELVVAVFIVLAPPVFGKDTVTWLHVWGAGAQREQVISTLNLWEKAYPDVKVEEIIMDSSNWQPKMIQMLSGDSPPDVFLWYPGPKTTELVDQGVIAPLNETWKQYKLDEQISSGLKAEVSYKGNIYNIPWTYHPPIVLYNKKMFGGLGLSIPQQIAEFEAVAAKIQATGKYPLSSGWIELQRSAYPLELLIPSLNGPDFYRELTKMNIDWGDPKCRKAWEIWKRWVQMKYWYPEPRSRRWGEGLSIFRNGEAGMYFIGTYAVPMLVEAGWKLGEDFGAFIFPQENKQFQPTFTGPFDTFCMPARAPHPDAARRFLAFLATKEPQAARLRASSGMSANKLVTEYDEVCTMLRKAMEKGAVFQGAIFAAMPTMVVEPINRAACVDFYDNPDIEEFVKKCEAARVQYWKEKKQ